MNDLPEHAYGMIVTIDGYGADTLACADESLLYKVLEELPLLISMRPLGDPHTVSVAEAGIRGVSGFRFIMESHISIHTYEERGFVTADIYSCRHFDASIVTEYLASAYSLRHVDSKIHMRGARFKDRSFCPSLDPPIDM